jgi:hypothetical protein
MEQTSTHPDLPDLDERRAHLLRFWLKQRGVQAQIHWDRSPWGVRIPLTSDDADRAEYAQPSLFVLTELQTLTQQHIRRIRWSGSLGGFDEEIDDALTYTIFEWIEPNDLSGDPDTNVKHLVEQLLPIINLLRDGALALSNPTVP